MALDPDTTAYFKRKLGSDVDLVDLEARLTRLEGDEEAVILEVREERLNTLLTKPGSFSIPGEYTESTNTEAIKQLAGLVGADNAGGVRIVSPVPENPAYDTEEALARRMYGTGGR